MRDRIWTHEEEELIAEMAARKRHGNRSLVGRREANQRLRSSCLIGETPPPLWPPGRPMPEENPRRHAFRARTAS
jgi:hypothetical protein